MSSERSPLLESGANGTQPRRSFSQRTTAFFTGENEPGFFASYRFLFLQSWLNIFLLFIPLSGVAHYLNWDAGLRFVFSFLAIVPLAKLIGEATDQMSHELGQTLAGLLNATFGNAVEIIVGIAALLHGEIRIVQTSMLGSILGNILLVLGSSFIAGGFRDYEGRFRVTAAQTSSSLMTLGCITLVIPAAYIASLNKGGLPPNSIPPEADAGLLVISRGTAILLLVVYASYLWFQLKTHAHLFIAKPQDNTEYGDGIGSGAPLPEEEEGAHMSTFAAATALLLVTVTTSFCADWLVASIEETADQYHIPKPFIGIILIPLVANAAEHVTSIWMALRGKYELTIGICVGSSIQIALLVVPLLVLVGWISGHELTLFFAQFETVVFFVSVILVNLLIQDGKSNYMEGLMLVTLYIVIGLAFWVS